MDLAIIFDSLSAIGPHFILKIAKLNCNPPLRDSAPPPHPPPLYISACGVDKNYLKWWELQIAMHCGEGSLIDIE